MAMTLEEAWADAHCPCHGVPWYVRPGGKRAGEQICQARRSVAQDRYYHSEKGRAAHARYRQSGKRSAGRARRYTRLKEAGLCVSCGKDVAITTLCFVCAGKKDEYNLTRGL